MLQKYGLIIGVIFWLASSIISGIGGYQYADNSWQTKWTARDAAEEKARADAVAAKVKEYNDRQIELEKATNDTKQLLANEMLARRAADDAADGLRQSIENILRNTRNNSGTTTIERAAAATNITVLANVLGRVDRRAGELAEIAGQRYIAGRDCEARYAIELQKQRGK